MSEDKLKELEKRIQCLENSLNLVLSDQKGIKHELRNIDKRVLSLENSNKKIVKYLDNLVERFQQVKFIPDRIDP